MARKKRRVLGTRFEIGESPAGWILPEIKEVPRLSRPLGTGTIDTFELKGQTYYRWRGYIEDAKGVKKRVPIYARTERELNRKVKKRQEQPASTDASRLTLERFLDDQFLPGMKLTVRPNTYSGYSTAVSNYIVPSIGKVKLNALKPSHALAWLSELEGGKRSKQRAFVVLKRALSYAVKLGLLERNPLAAMTAPSAPAAEQYILSGDEIKKLLGAAKGQWLVLIHLAIATSLRLGELLGLRWRDVNFEDGYVYVTKALGREYDDLAISGMRYAITDPKTGASIRRVDLSAPAIDLLTAHGRRAPDDLVFPNADGGFINPTNFRLRVWYPLLTEAGLPRVKFHSLRHAGNTLLAQQGVSLALLQQRLGHSTPAVTLQVYSHVGQTEGRRGAELLGDLLG